MRKLLWLVLLVLLTTACVHRRERLATYTAAPPRFQAIYASTLLCAEKVAGRPIQLPIDSAVRVYRIVPVDSLHRVVGDSTVWGFFRVPTREMWLTRPAAQRPWYVAHEYSHAIQLHALDELAPRGPDGKRDWHFPTLFQACAPEPR